MKIEEAIHELLLQKDNPYDREVTDKTCDVAIVALRKQIPKEPKMYVGEYDYERYPLCSDCGTELMPNGEEYCPNCGQALKWE